MQQDLIKAKEIILSGGVVGIPTETVYGLAASIDSSEGIKNIFQYKERPFFDPLIVHISDLKQLDSITAGCSEIILKFANIFWPGPLTLILPKHQSLNPMITAGLETVAVRMPSHLVAKELINICQVPLAAPSANKFGKTSPTTAEHVRREWPNGEVFVIDGGPSAIGIESTVLQIKEEGDVLKLEIFRPGYILEEDLEKAALFLGKKVLIERVESEKSPGHLPYHYQPEIPLVLVENSSELSAVQLQEIKNKLNLKNLNYKLLELNNSAAIAARELYSKLRELSQSDADFILLYKKQGQTKGLWRAVWDRLNRAATIKIN